LKGFGALRVKVGLELLIVLVGTVQNVAHIHHHPVISREAFGRIDFHLGKLVAKWLPIDGDSHSP